MRSAEDAPLPFSVWSSELAALSDYCRTAPPGEEDRAIRRLFHLFRLSAPSVRALGNPQLEEDELEQVLERDGAEAAFLSIAGKRPSFQTARAEGDTAQAAAAISFDDEPPVFGEGTSPIYAMIAAWANYFTKPR